MSFYNRNAITLVRLVAAGFFLIGLLDLALEWFKKHHDHTDLNLLRCAYLSLPILVGIAILIKSAALARWVDQYLDE